MKISLLFSHSGEGFQCALSFFTPEQGMWRPSSFGYSFSSQIRKLPPLLLLFSAKLSSCTHYVRTSLYLPRFGSAQLSSAPIPLSFLPQIRRPPFARAVSIFGSPFSPPPKAATRIRFVYLTFPSISPSSLTRPNTTLPFLRTLSIRYGYCKLRDRQTWKERWQKWRGGEELPITKVVTHIENWAV